MLRPGGRLSELLVGRLSVNFGSNLALWVKSMTFLLSSQCYYIMGSFSDIEHLCRTSVKLVIRKNVPPPQNQIDLGKMVNNTVLCQVNAT